eukprot:c20741_g1_i1 orf=148-312(-)
MSVLFGMSAMEEKSIPWELINTYPWPTLHSTYPHQCEGAASLPHHTVDNDAKIQ